MSQLNELQLEALLKFKNRDKFSIESWNERGLNPSSDEMSVFLNDVFSSCASQLMDAINNNASKKQLQEVLKINLFLLNKMDYDTEEREFICSLFEELSGNISIDFSDKLNKWLYGSLLTTLSKIRNILQPTKVIDTLIQPCDGCGTELESYIIKADPGIPETDWLIVKCNNCDEFNLISVGAGVKELKFGNYQWIENVRMAEFTYEQAIMRVKQLKFKKNKF